MAGSSAATWRMLVADDYHLEAGGEEYRFDLMTFFIVCSIVGVPLSWNKTSGGETVTWVGFELLHRTGSEGGRQRLRVPVSVHMPGHERRGGTLERLFVGPVYRFMSLHPRDSVRAVPPYVSFFLRHWQSRSHSAGTTTVR